MWERLSGHQDHQQMSIAVSIRPQSPIHKMEFATIVNSKMKFLSMKLRVLAGMMALGYAPSGAMRTDDDDDE